MASSASTGKMRKQNENYQKFGSKLSILNKKDAHAQDIKMMAIKDKGSDKSSQKHSLEQCNFTGGRESSLAMSEFLMLLASSNYRELPSTITNQA